MRSTRLPNTERSGFSFLELQVALILLGIAFAAMVPLVIMNSRQLKNLETFYDHRTTDDVNRADYEPTIYQLVPTIVEDRPPSASTWARKLGAPAVILGYGTDPPESGEELDPEPEFDVQLLWSDTSLDTWRNEDKVQAKVWVKEIPEEEEDEDEE